MKPYPSIPRADGRTLKNCYIFDKLDGSNIRVEWTPKAGFYKFGRRNGLLDSSNEILYKEVPEVFSTMEDDYSRILTDNRWSHCVLFFEFWGRSSFAGNHLAGEIKSLTLIDVAVNKRGIIPPKDFLDNFAGRVETARFLGRMNWNKQLVERVKRGEMDGMTFEGVVGKQGGTQGRIYMIKAKSQAWKDKVISVFGNERGSKILKS